LTAASSAPGRAIATRATGSMFAFYGRVSTEDYQDPVTSRARQRDQAAALVAGFGLIVAEFFDVGWSRVLAWTRRPQAAALLAALADPDRGSDAIVIGEYERAFYGPQYAAMALLFEHYVVQLWMPEAGGRVNFAGEGDEQLMLALGVQSKREITRTRIRVRTAMAAQTRDQGRYLGGRPPYGLPAGRRGPAPEQGPRRLGTPGAPARTRSAHRAGGALDVRPAPGRAQPGPHHPGAQQRGHPLPVGRRPSRNPHRSGAAWTLFTVPAILANPRYTGHQVWNRQPTSHELIDPANTGLGHRQVQRWALPDGWVISTRPAHPALVSEEDFIAVQNIRAERDTGASTKRRYLLAGLLRCGICGRRLESCWASNRAAYRRPTPPRP
jgi:site-specific DNA recombinase